MAEGAKGYLESIRKSFPRLSIREKRFLRDLEDSLISFEEEHPENSTDAYAEEFGTPQEIVRDFYDHSGLELYREMLHQHKSNQRGSVMVAGIIAAMMVMPFAAVTPPCVHQVKACRTSVRTNIEPKISVVKTWEVGE